MGPPPIIPYTDEKAEFPQHRDKAWSFLQEWKYDNL